VPLAAYDGIVLAGGFGTRLGGVDKAMLDAGGRTFLDRVLEALGGAERVVVAGPARPIAAPVLFVQDDPPGGGPAAGIAAALASVERPLVVVAAVDAPLLTRDTVERLVAAVEETDGAVLVDSSGQDQPLTAVYRTSPLRAALAGEAAGRSVRSVVRQLSLRRLPDHADLTADADTWEGVEQVRRRLRGDCDARGLDD
jgi:molybdopterin-guanine dinucleotide biosynthesis protein A